MKVLHLTWGMGTGGKERFLDQLVRGLDSSQFDQQICCLRARGAFYAPLVEDGFALCYLGKRHALDAFAAIRLRGVIRASDPDIIHAHDFTSHLLATMATCCRGTRPRVVATLHGGHTRLSPFKAWLYRKMLGKASRVVCVAKSQIPELERQIGTRGTIVNIPYGVDPARFDDAPSPSDIRTRLGIPADAPVVAMVARFEQPKDQDSLVRAAPQILSNISQCHFVLVGDGSRRSLIHEAVVAGGIEAAFHFVTATTEVRDILSMASVCVLPSFHEGLPICILEYMAAGRPVVASDVDGVGEMFRDGEEGFLIGAGDSAALADRVSALLAEPAKAVEMGQRARMRVESRFSLRGMLAAYTRLYCSLVR